MMPRMVMFMQLLFYASVAFIDGAKVVATDAPSPGLRGMNVKYLHSSINNDIDNSTQEDVHLVVPHHPVALRSLRKDTGDAALQQENDNIIILSQPLSFQITMSIVLGLFGASQIALLIAFFVNRSKRVLEFAQPIYVCMMIASGLITTCACYLYLYITNVGCIIREPIIFISLSLMGSIIAARAWRISTLMSNPLINAGRGDNETDTPAARVERIRKFIMKTISVLSGCDYSAFNLLQVRRTHSGGRPLRVQINNLQMMRAILLLCVPQIILQVVAMGVPALRYTKTLSSPSSYDFDAFTGSFSQYQCQSSTSASWAVYIFSVLLVALPFHCAYLLNIRPKVEMEKLPQIIDERRQIKVAFISIARLVATNAPIIGMTWYYQCPSIRAYTAVVTIIGVVLFVSYYIAYIKLGALKSNKMHHIGGTSNLVSSANGDSTASGRGSAAYAVKMADMYSKIGRTEETLTLIDETLGVWKKEENSGGVLALSDQRRDAIGAGFTRQDLERLTPEDLEMIIQLLIIKGDALMKLHGPAAFPLSAELNIAAMRIFESSPASKKMKDTSIMFPIYNRVGIQLKGGVIHQDDSCNLERDLYSKFHYESQVQAFHLVRSLGALAEWYGRIGEVDKAFRYFNTMNSIYMPDEHAPLLYQYYSVNRCAITYAISALWFLQKGQPKQAIQRCDQVINEVLPSYDTKDMIGLYHIFWAVIRVLKWNGEIEKAREMYAKWAPDGIENHFAMGIVHKPMCLLLKVCDGNPDGDYETEDMEADIDMVLEFDAPDMTDKNLLTDGWSIKSMAAELCLHLARRLEAGSVIRRKLVDRGIQMSSIANERNTTAEGLIKHILAHEAHKGIDDRLLALRKEDNAIDLDIVYRRDEGINGSRRDSLGSNMQTNGALKHYDSFDFASKFTVNKTSGMSHSSTSVSRSGTLKKNSKTSKNSYHSKDSTGSTSKPFISSHISMHSLSKRQSDCESINELAPVPVCDGEEGAFFDADY